MTKNPAEKKILEINEFFNSSRFVTRNFDHLKGLKTLELIIGTAIMLRTRS